MARARNIKPGFYHNDQLAECSVWARFIFPGLWMMADRDGKLEDRPARIKAALLPYDSQNVDKLLSELERHGFIRRYQAAGGKYILIINFRKHQNPHVKEPKSDIPGPGEITEGDGKTPEPSGARTGLESGETGSGPADSGFRIPSPDSGLLKGSEPASAGPEPPAPPERWGDGEIQFEPSTGTWHGITEAHREIWASAYPAVKIDEELARAASWQVANPTKKKSNYSRFLDTWFKGEQDKGGTRTKSNPRYGGQAQSRTEYAKQTLGGIL